MMQRLVIGFFLSCLSSLSKRAISSSHIWRDIVYTAVKFYLLKPEHVPKPEKENIIMGSPGSTPEDEEIELEPARDRQTENFRHQIQPNREAKKEA